VGPVITEVVQVDQPVAGLDEHLVQADLRGGNAWVALFGLERTQVAFHHRVVRAGSGSDREPVQVGVVPVECRLQDLVHVVEKRSDASSSRRQIGGFALSRSTLIR